MVKLRTHRSSVSGGAPIKTSAFCVLVLFLIELADHYTRFPFDNYGIVPRTVIGLRGILFSPLLHGSWQHLLANALPLFVLLAVLFADRRYEPELTLAMIWVASGLGTWLIGRPGSMHVGASSVIFGLVAYLIVAGFLMGSWRAVLVAALVLFFFGGIFYGVLPQAGPISWEGHLSGAIAGVWAGRRNHSRGGDE